MNRGYLSLGSNIGERKENILRAYEILESHGIRIISQSSFYETAPIGFEDQASFINSVIHIETKLGAYELLEKCHLVEKALKRKRVIRWGPRTIDVDILLFNELTLNEPDLIIPHKEIKNRAFVLIPLKEIADSIMISGDKIQELLDQLDTTGVRLIHNGR
ncbi:MAG TPA: 2-amino-4-hydroxy-6-hydroxymethyldihydropteridine diphosphokinase [Clostridia bacterium]|nr:2-amino-4-hydroxy-6-hydroxymethyldihydropteridine diphosphokinase [Clostridia bacterium]